MTPRRFRQLLVLWFAASVAAFVAGMFGTLWYSPALRLAWESEPLGAFGGITLLPFVLAPVALCAGLLGIGGLWTFKAWGRTFALWSTVAIHACTPLLGVLLLSPVEALLRNVSTMLSGVILALAYFSPLRLAFEGGAALDVPPAPAAATAMPPAGRAAAATCAIGFQGMPSAREFATVHNSLLPWWARPRMYVVYFLLYELVAEDLLPRLIHSPAQAVLNMLPLLGAVLALWLFVHLLQQRQYRDIRNTLGALGGSLGEDAVEWRTQVASSTFTWDRFSRVARIDDLVLLYYQPRCALFFARHFFDSEAAWDSFIALANRRVGPPRQP